MKDQYSTRKDGDTIKVYLVQDLWDAEAVESTRSIPELTEDDLWATNQITLTQDVLGKMIHRVGNVDMSYPITLFADGRVADGIHRILYAGSHNIFSINVRQLVVDPKPIQVVKA